MFVSVITLVIAIGHGRTMERMADANMRMVEANSWPFVDFSNHDRSEKGEAQVRLVLTNEGIGPARIETFELWWRGKSISSPMELLKDCCTVSSGHQQGDAVISLGLASPRILRAGEHVDFLSVSRTPAGRELFEKLETERDYIRTRFCYCSVFDECWIKEGGDEFLRKDQSKLIRPDRVKTCPVPPVPYQVSVATPANP